ncbi:UDP-Glc:alpha-D-GlcNAc-diphosphoundecaprenol beta-1,3-glucosyltransferase WfgD [mine drainage metagenome]|uniref:UDP-Glc:alpha-D-GlcNAc-diphosphoundecaprenol beta-1,3-glucosyltransferase WfgD n=1 Tax=mine drainage metagenome TaxID=410659 RepID=A0A1J5SLS0_9ZZZZ
MPLGAHRVSVCVATYNGEKYFRQQLESILSQLSADDEVIISDNCSTDLTREVINSIGDARVTLHTFNIRSVVSNFENAFRSASGDVIVIADQDDVWMDGKIDRIKRELEAYDLVVTDCKVVDEQLNLLHQSLFELIKPRTGIFRNLMRNSYTGCCMAFNRRVLDAALPFPNNLPMHDWWIGLVGEVVGPVKFIDEPFLLYRRHGSNVSTLSTPSALSLWKKISMRIILLSSLFYRFVLKV